MSDIIGDSMKFIELNKNLKEKINNLYNITGNDDFLIKQAITNLKYALVKDLEEFNYFKADAENMKSSEAVAQISTLPLGNNYRLVVLTNPNSEVVKEINKLNLTDGSVVVVCVNAIKLNNAEIIDCEKLDRLDISKYVLNYLAKNKLSIEERALDYLIEATNSNMSKLNNELNKLTAYCVDIDTITIDIVSNMVPNTAEYVVYMLTNAIDTKNFTSYQKIINEMSKNISMAEIFSYLGKYFKRMQYVCLNKNDDELAKILNIKPYAIKMSRQNVNKNGIKFYINLYEKYVNLDYKIKSGKISATNALYELVF